MCVFRFGCTPKVEKVKEIVLKCKNENTPILNLSGLLFIVFALMIDYVTISWFTERKLRDQETMCLSIILVRDHVVRELDLSGEDTTINNDVNVFECLTLFFIGNFICNDGFKALSGMLMKNTTLTVLKLGREKKTLEERL